MNSRPANLGLASWLESNPDMHEFVTARDRLERALSRVLREVDVAIVHNVFNLHYNLPLTAALHRLAERGPHRALHRLVPRHLALREPGPRVRRCGRATRGACCENISRT